eukprot:gene12933-biopygen11032
MTNRTLPRSSMDPSRHRTQYNGCVQLSGHISHYAEQTASTRTRLHRTRSRQRAPRVLSKDAKLGPPPPACGSDSPHITPCGANEHPLRDLCATSAPSLVIAGVIAGQLVAKKEAEAAAADEADLPRRKRKSWKAADVALPATPPRGSLVQRTLGGEKVAEAPASASHTSGKKKLRGAALAPQE